MQPLNSESTFHQLSGLLVEKMGIYFSRDHWKDMERGISAATNELGFKDTQSCINGLLSSSLTKKELEVLASHLTVGETYFFREPRSFEFIEKHILADIVRERSGKDQYLRIWSAGCASGEEAYSIAILLDRYLPDISDWNIKILATDINPRFLQKATDGLYTDWSFRGVPAWLKRDYFTNVTKGRYQVIPRIRQMVNFSYHNLAEDSYPSLINGTNAMDLIFCRNVLMYFDTQKMKRVVEKLRLSLVEEGWLNVSSVEISNQIFSAFKPVNLQGITFYKNSDVNSKENPVNGNAFVFDMLDVEPKFEIKDVALPEIDTVPVAAIIPDMEQTELPVALIEPVTKDPLDEARQLFKTGRYADATEKLTSIVADDPDDIHSMNLLARSLANQGQLTEACDWCRRIISIDKLNAGCYYLLASIQHELGLIEEAITTLKCTLYLEPEFVLAHFALGNHTRMQGRLKESSRHFENARVLLDRYQPEDVLLESEGITVKRLKEIIELTTGLEAA